MYRKSLLWMVEFIAGEKDCVCVSVCVFCLEKDLCNALCNACGATLSLCHSSMRWHMKQTQPCLSDTRMEQGHFLLHQTVIHCKTAVNSHPRHTLRTGTVNYINLRMTQFNTNITHSTLANLSFCGSGESLSCQTCPNLMNLKSL